MFFSDYTNINKNTVLYVNRTHWYFRRVHISADTLRCLNDVYEVEPGNGVERDNYLKDRDVETYLIKQVEPLRSRRRYSSRPKIWMDGEAPPDNRTKKSFKVGNSLVVSNPATAHSGSIGGANAHQEEDPGTEWTPEIPFENVSLVSKLN